MPRHQLIASFPKLATDTYFKITSPPDQKYNCIAWAAIKSDIIWWPHPKKNPLDGTDWPYNLPRVNTLENFIELFSNKTYRVCANWEFEEGFQKIAIYQNPATLECTHASRQQIDGVWTSKLGGSHDIIHGDPYTVEGIDYGKVVTIMKRENSFFKLSGVKR